jgi:DNA-binding MarR family transcriptional regulator
MATQSGGGETVGPSICACVNMRRASRAVTRLYDRALEPSGLKVTQYSVLANVMRSGPINVTRLAALLVLDRTTLVRNLKPLEAAGFLKETATRDPREKALEITAAGRDVVEAAAHHWKGVQTRLRDHLGTDLLDQLAVLVTALEEL